MFCDFPLLLNEAKLNLRVTGLSIDSPKKEEKKETKEEERKGGRKGGRKGEKGSFGYVRAWGHAYA